MKTAMVTGSNGQLGSYFCELLLDKGYFVVATVRRRSDDSLERIRHLLDNPNLKLEVVDILDSGCLNRVVGAYKPSELYHAAAQSFVKLSWDEPYHTSLATALGTLNVLEAVRNSSPATKLWFAGSSEQFGRVQDPIQSEVTRFMPLSPYAVAKLYSYEMVRVYRESYNLFCCSSINFNSESPRRGIEFVTKKISDGVARVVKAGNSGTIKLGNIEARRDWSFAGDTVYAAWLMLQASEPRDYVVSSGETHSIKEFLELAFNEVGLDWKAHVEYDAAYSRPNDVQLLLGDSSKIRKELGWEPKVSFKQLVKDMVAADLIRHGVK